MTEPMTCPLCGGTGVFTPRPDLPHAEKAGNAVALITLALDHAIAGDADAFTWPELLAVMGDGPLADVVPQLAMVASIAAGIVRHVARDDESAREWWTRLSQWLLSGEDAE